MKILLLVCSCLYSLAAPAALVEDIVQIPVEVMDEHRRVQQQWGKDYPHRWFEAFHKQGGNAQFVQLPASGRDGHSSFTANPRAWKPHVEEFLKSIGFVL